MQKILSLLRRCVQDYDMIQANDSVAVGLSGGKDSLSLLAALAALRRFYPQPFTLRAVLVDMTGGRADYALQQAFCDSLEVPLTIAPSDIFEVVFDIRKEKNPCSLCANMRRGALNTTAKSLGCNKVALGHHKDDAVETFYLSLFYEGRLSCFSPVSYMSRIDLTVIRPMLYVPEYMLRSYAERAQLPVFDNPCPANHHTRREEVKELVRELSHRYPNLSDKTFGAIQRAGISGFHEEL